MTQSKDSTIPRRAAGTVRSKTAQVAAAGKEHLKAIAAGGAAAAVAAVDVTLLQTAAELLASEYAAL